MLTYTKIKTFFKKIQIKVTNPFKRSTKLQNYKITGSNFRDRIVLLAFVGDLKKRVGTWKISFFTLLFCTLFFATSGFSLFKSQNIIAKVKLYGPIITNDEVIETLTKIKENKNIKAVIFYINSPGGTITGSEILYLAINEISQAKPTIAIIQDLGASGAYMASLGTDYIIAKNTSLVGSVGVIMEMWNLEELAKKIGVNKTSFKTSKFKGAPSSFEQNSDDINTYINTLIKDGFDYFTAVVEAKRGDKIKDKAEAFSGKIFSGRQALALGLVDAIGDLAEAKTFLKQKNSNLDNLEIKEIKLIKDDENDGFIDRLIKRGVGTASKAVIENTKTEYSNSLNYKLVS